jgi:hypothetical protein
MKLVESATLDEVLTAHAPALGRDFTGYRNHAHRVMNLCLALSPSDDDARQSKIAIAAAFHDLGIWTAGTFDYIEPSAKLASAHLARSSNAPWGPEIDTAIREHHKLFRYRPHPDWLVEPFRKADLIDVSRGVVRFGLPRGLIKDLFAQWPSAGFHKRLVQLSLTRLKTHPLSPLPMVRL